MKVVRKLGDGIKKFVVRTKEIVVQPGEFFVRTLSKEKSIGKGLRYYGELLVFNLILSTGILIVYKSYWKEVDWVMLAGAAVVTLAVRVIYAFVGSWFLNVLVRFLGGKADYKKTFLVFVYSKAPFMIFEPLLGFIAQLYGYWVQAVGIKHAYGFSYKRTAFLYGVVLVIFFCIYLGLAMYIGRHFGIMTSLGG